MSFTIEHDGATFDFAALPLASQRALAREGLVHIRGNRVASKVVGFYRSQAAKDYNAEHGEGAFAKLDSAAQSRIAKASIPDSESEEYISKVREFRAEADAARRRPSRLRTSAPTPRPSDRPAAADCRTSRKAAPAGCSAARP